MYPTIASFNVSLTPRTLTTFIVSQYPLIQNSPKIMMSRHTILVDAIAGNMAMRNALDVAMRNALDVYVRKVKRRLSIKDPSMFSLLLSSFLTQSLVPKSVYSVTY